MFQIAAPTASPLLPAFWPFSESHALHHVPLETEPPSRSDEVLPLLLRLGAQSDAMRGLQTADGTVISEQGATALKKEMADGLLLLAELVDEQSAARIRLRADVLAGRKDAQETTLQIAADGGAGPALEVVCGPLCTWRPKTRDPLHSFVASVRNESSQELLEDLDASLEEGLDDLRRDLDGRLKAAFALPMNITDLLAVGGEAAGHPKHFAYFLPEDEGVDDLPLEEQRTLYLRNVHLERYRQITVPLGEDLLEGPIRTGDVPIETTLLPWIRGHDHCHNLVLPETDYEWSGRLGIEPFMALQEAIADVYGFLLAISDPWLELAGGTRANMCATHIAELLHYLRRGPWHHGDAGAAHVELSFLAQNDFVQVDPAGRISWTEEGFCEGMIELAKALTKSTVAAKDEGPSRKLLDQYGWPESAPAWQPLGTPAGRTVTAIRGLASVPTSIAFYRTESPLVTTGLDTSYERSLSPSQ